MTRSVRIISSLVVVALLSGCAIGPDYKRPAVARPETFRGQATAEAASLADVPWWEAFQDPILKGLIQDALRSNYDVGIAAARVQEARANLGVARSDYFPSLDYGLGASVDHATDRYRQGLASYYEVLEAQQQLYPAQTTLAQIRQDRLLTNVRLYKALGGGWSLSDAQWTAQQHEMAR